jgi:hypothetical protein
MDGDGSAEDTKAVGCGGLLLIPFSTVGTAATMLFGPSV